MVRVSAADPNMKMDFPTATGGGKTTPAAEDVQMSDRRIRSKYRQIENRINEENDDIANVTSDKFLAIMKEVESIHEQVKRPREQVSDAGALLGLTTSLVNSVKIHTNGGVTPAEFISCVMKKYGQKKSMNELNDVTNIKWNDIGSDVSCAFMIAKGCNTMIGPIRSEIKPRKVYVRAKRTKPTGRDHPNELKERKEAETDTDRNIRLMFHMLKKKKQVNLEKLILNRKCFAQTVENLFAMSFLVKDGRVSIKVDEKGSHIVAPNNGPSAEQVRNGEARSSQFMFRFEHNDWKLMKARVLEGEELMPHRDVNADGELIQEVIPIVSEKQYLTEPVKKFSQKHVCKLESRIKLSVPELSCKRKRSVL